MINYKNREVLITRVLTGEATDEEFAELKQWISLSKDNLLLFQQLRNIWDASEHVNVEKMIDVDKAFQTINKRVTFKYPLTNFWQFWRKIAAILIIPLLLSNIVYFSFHFNKSPSSPKPVYSELFATFGTRSALKLSDGTSVWLNSGSSLKYPDRFTGGNRTVILEGEAYFEVESNPRKPFIVETSYLNVRATGTKFNVSGYASDDEAEVTLVSGSVEVSLTTDKNNVNTSRLDPNQHFSYNKTNGKVCVINDDTYKYISWKDGKLIFRNEPLSNVVKKISQVFNIDIEIQGEEIMNYNLRATFQDESLSEILKLIELSSPIHYVEVKRTPLPDGTFPRKKIIIFPNGQTKPINIVNQ